MRIKIIIIALLLNMHTLLTPMDNEHKDDYHASLMSILDTYYPEAHSGTTSPIPAAAAASPAHYAPVFFQQFSPLRTQNPYAIPYQADIEQIDSEDFFDIDELDEDTPKPLSAETFLQEVDVHSFEPLSHPTQQASSTKEKLSAELNIPVISKTPGDSPVRCSFHFNYKNGKLLPYSSQEAKSLLKKRLAPFLQTMPSTKRQLPAHPKRTAASKEISCEVKQNNPEDFFDIDEDTTPKAHSVEPPSRGTTAQGYSLEPFLFSEKPQSPSKETLYTEPSIPPISKKHDDPRPSTFSFNFKSGRLIRTGENFECPVLECKYNTQRYNELKAHILYKHTDFRPYMCPHPACQKVFSQTSNLHTHAKKNHPGMHIPPLSQETKDTIQKTLAPFLQTLSGTKE